MPIKKITNGLIYAQTTEGTQTVDAAMTKTASVVIEGQTLVNRQYLVTGKGPFNKKTGYTPTVKVNGVLTGCAVTGDATVDNVEVAAGTAYINGATVTVSADATMAITRGAASNYVVHAVCVSASGTLSVIAGSAATTLDLTGGFGGGGQKPLVATTLIVLAYVVTLGDAAAVIPSTDIYAGESANIDYRIDSLRGGIVLYEALPLSHTGGVSRGIYVTFYDLSTALSVVGTVEDGTLTINKKAPVPTPNNDTTWDTFESMPGAGWNLQVKKWRSDQFWADKMLDPFSDEFYLKLTEDSADAFSWYGFGILNGDYSVNVKRGPVSETLKFQGNGELRRAA